MTVSPQIENGHLDLANEIVEQFARLNLCAGEWRVLWAILRKTYGWHKKIDRITYTQFEEVTGIDRRHIKPHLDRLVRRDIIIRIGNGQKLYYGLQKDYSKWKPLLKQVIVPTITQTSNEPLPKQVTRPLPKQVNTKEKKETLKRKSDFGKSLISLFSEIESDFKPEDLQYKQEFLDYWTETNPNGKKEHWQMEKVFDVKRRFQTWLRNNNRWNKQTDDDQKEQEIEKFKRRFTEQNQ